MLPLRKESWNLLLSLRPQKTHLTHDQSPCPVPHYLTAVTHATTTHEPPIPLISKADTHTSIRDTHGAGTATVTAEDKIITGKLPTP